MEIAKTTSDEWKALYKAAIEFREIEPWKWVKETDLFGVKDPLTGKTGYCCVIGEMGEVLGMSVYLGAQGLNVYQMVQKEMLKPESSDFLFLQDCILVSFENKGALEKEDKAQIRELGIQAKGKKAWPMLRRYEPGYFPWFLAPEEVRFLAVVLSQAKEMCIRLKKDGALLHSPQKNLYLLRTFDETSKCWKDEWTEPDPALEAVLPSIKVDEVTIQRIKKNIRHSRAVWEIDFFHLISPVFEGARPYYPYSIMIADKESRYIHHVNLSRREEAPSEFSSQLLACIEKSNMVPAEILVKRREVAHVFSTIAGKLDIKLSKVNRLPAVDEARESMEAQFLTGKEPSFASDEDCEDCHMEELLQKVGSKLSIFGLYGLIYGYISTSDLPMPSVLVDAIFEGSSAHFNSRSEAQEIGGCVMELWNQICEWDPKSEEIILPFYEYPDSKEGVLSRISDALDLAAFFVKGQELGGLSIDTSEKLEENTEQIARIIGLLRVHVQLLGDAKKPSRKEIAEAIKAAENAEFVIDGCIMNICRERRETHSISARTRHASPASHIKVGRNEPCPCGSGKKYKKCCGLVH